ncbi:GNAT family protein [Nisaea sediminum]|uniref:hypothetical protein n=1 Tax=Nisaea sediminum TaxID=2775867 RepID=UPI001865D930|nr:hypothetical protein [Nisaea sediminum]
MLTQETDAATEAAAAAAWAEISDNGASILTRATGQRIQPETPIHMVRTLLTGFELAALSRFRKYASTGECRYAAAMLVALGFGPDLQRTRPGKALLKTLDSYGIDNVLRRDIANAWLEV